MYCFTEVILPDLHTCTIDLEVQASSIRKSFSRKKGDTMDQQQWFGQRQSRRRMLKQLGALAGAGLALDPGLSGIDIAAAAANPIKHVLVACQENRTFDEYFGYYPKAGSFGIPAGYYQPDGQGGKVYPYHFQSYSTSDVSHSWQSTHSEWDMGKMDGIYTTDGSNAMGYYNGSDLSYYYSLARNFTLCGNYFCYQLGPTTPNRLALWTATRGGNKRRYIHAGS